MGGGAAGLPEGAPGAAPRVTVTAAVAQAGVVDLRLAWELRLSEGVVGDLLGGGPDEHPARYALASPAERVPLGVPVLLTHGGRDDIVPPSVTAAYARAARAAGDEVEVVELPTRTTSATSTRRTRCGRRSYVAGVTERAHAEALDAADPLAGFRDRFELGDGRHLYLDGNSLGRLPLATRERLHATIEQWGAELVGGWHDWIDLPLRAGDALGGLIGAAPGRGRGHRLDDGEPLQARARGARRGAAAARSSPTAATSRRTATCSRGSRRARGAELRLFDADELDGPVPADLDAWGPATWRCSPTSPTARARSPTWPG